MWPRPKTPQGHDPESAQFQLSSYPIMSKGLFFPILTPSRDAREWQGVCRTESCYPFPHLFYLFLQSRPEFSTTLAEAGSKLRHRNKCRLFCSDHFPTSWTSNFPEKCRLRKTSRGSQNGTGRCKPRPISHQTIRVKQVPTTTFILKGPYWHYSTTGPAEANTFFTSLGHSRIPTDFSRQMTPLSVVKTTD